MGFYGSADQNWIICVGVICVFGNCWHDQLGNDIGVENVVSFIDNLIYLCVCV